MFKRNLRCSHWQFTQPVNMCFIHMEKAFNFIIMFIIFMDIISRRSQGLQFGNDRISSLIFTDYVVLLASTSQNLQHVLRWFTGRVPPNLRLCEKLSHSRGAQSGAAAPSRWEESGVGNKSEQSCRKQVLQPSEVNHEHSGEAMLLSWRAPQNTPRRAGGSDWGVCLGCCLRDPAPDKQRKKCNCLFYV